MKKIQYNGSSKILKGIAGKVNAIIDKLIVDVKVNGTSVVVVNQDGEREADIDLSLADQNVKQSPTTSSDNSDYRVLLSKSANDTEETDISRKDTNLKYNPSTGNLQTTKLNGNTVPSGSDTIALTSDIPTVVNTYDGTSTDAISGMGVKAALDTLPEPMVYKGSLGVGGTIADLPMDGSATIGDTYKVITEGDYGNNTYHAKVGDTFICFTKTSSANTWTLIPSGDEPSGTVTSITIKATSPIAVNSSSAITTSGTRTISHVASGVTADSYGDSSAQTPGFGGTFKALSATVNATGHITAMGEHTVTIPSAVATTSASGLMSASDKTKLDGIAQGAEANVQSDWSITDTSSDAFIKNKPSIPTITDTYSGTSHDGMSGVAVKSAIDALDGNLNNTTPGKGKTLTLFSQTDGKVSAKFENISITTSQISNFPSIPTVNDAKLTINQNGTLKGEFTANQSGNGTTVNLTDTTYESKAASSGGTDLSLVTTGEKYTWNSKAGSDVNVKQTDITDNSWRCLTMASDNTKTEDTAGVRKTVGLSMQVNKVGTASQTGQIVLAIGNSIATGNADNYRGFLDIYNNGKRSRIYSNTTADRNMIIPNKAGTFALTNDIPTVNDATLTINQNDTLKGTFTSNDSDNVTVNLTDEKVKQNVLENSNTGWRRLLLGNNNDNVETDYANKFIGLTFQPSTGYLSLNSQDGMKGTVKYNEIRIGNSTAVGTLEPGEEPTVNKNVKGRIRLYADNTYNVVLTTEDGKINGNRTLYLPDKNAKTLAVTDDIPTKTSQLTNDSNFPVDASYVHTDNNYTSTEKTKLSGIAENAEVNQNTFAKIKVGSTTITADAKQDTLELFAGDNVTLTSDVTNDKVTISATDTTYTAGSGLSLSGTEFSNSGVTGVRGNAESSYRTGQVILTPANIGALSKSGSETKTGNLTLNRQDGTTTEVGETTLYIGNNLGSGVDKNSKGAIRLYGQSGKYVTIRSVNDMDNTRSVWFRKTGSSDKYIQYESTMSANELTTGTATTSRTVRADYLNAGIKTLISNALAWHLVEASESTPSYVTIPSTTSWWDVKVNVILTDYALTVPLFFTHYDVSDTTYGSCDMRGGWQQDSSNGAVVSVKGEISGNNYKFTVTRCIVNRVNANYKLILYYR